MNAPQHLGHKPIIAVNDYEKIDGTNEKDQTDVRALSIGQAQYDKDDISLKIWRNKDKKRWSRQSEEMPVHRALDLCILALGAILTDTTSNYPMTSLREEIVEKNRVKEIGEYYENNKHILKPRLEELKSILNVFFERNKS